MKNNALVGYEDLMPERTLSYEDKAFNAASEAYESVFGAIPYGPGMPEITTDLLLSAVKAGVEISLDIPDGADA